MFLACFGLHESKETSPFSQARETVEFDDHDDSILWMSWILGCREFPGCWIHATGTFFHCFFWHFRWFHGKFHDHFSFVVPHHAIVWSEFISFIFICDLLHLFATSAAAGIWLCNCCGGIAATQRLCGFNVWFPMALKCLFFDLMWLLI